MSTMVGAGDTAQFDGANAEALADELGSRFSTAREAISNFIFVSII